MVLAFCGCSLVIFVRSNLYLGQLKFSEDKKNIFGRPNEEGVIPFKPLPMKDYYTEVKKQYLDRYERDGMTEKYQELIRVNFPKDALKEQKEIFETLSFPVYNFKEPPEGEEVGF